MLRRRLLVLVGLPVVMILVQHVEAYTEMETETETESVVNMTASRNGLFRTGGLSRSLENILSLCTESEDFFWCFKIQAAKLLGRALKVQNINIIDGFTIVKKGHGNGNGNGNETQLLGRANGDGDSEHLNLSNRDIENLSMKSLDVLLLERFEHFMKSRQVQINLPRMLKFAEHNSQHVFEDILNYITSLLPYGNDSDDESIDQSEGRGKKKDKKYLGMAVAAVMLKAAILKMAYHSIAIIAGKALIVGKIALIISAIIGLKKLVSKESGEKTTYEIVKHPQVQQSHTYSSSHTGEYEGGHESGSSGGSYHRSIDDEMMMQDKAYHAWIPTTKIS